MAIASQLVDSSVFRATWTLRRSDQPVANSVPDTQPNLLENFNLYRQMFLTEAPAGLKRDRAR